MSDYTHIRNTAEFKVVEVHRSTYVPFRHYVSGAFQYLGGGSKGYRARAWYVQEKVIEKRYIPDPVFSYKRILEEALTSAGLIDDENLRGYHSTRVLADLRSSVADMATMIAESGETIAYLGLLATRARRALPNVIRAYQKMRDPNREIRLLRRFLKGKRYGGAYNKALHRRIPPALRDASAYWLEFNYALMPLWFEASNVYHMLRVQTRGRFIREASEDLDEFEFSKQTDYGFGTVSWDFKISTRAAAVGKAYVAADQIERYKRSFYIPTAMWEVVPYSFVVDWFVNVSDYIQAYRETVGQNEAICSVISFCVVGTATLKLDEPNHPSHSEIPWEGTLPSPYDVSEIVGDPVLMEAEVLSYVRKLEDLTPSLHLHMNMSSWRRKVSATALTILQLNRFKRR